MGRIHKHTETDNLVLCIVLIKLKHNMAIIAVKDK